MAPLVVASSIGNVDASSNRQPWGLKWRSSYWFTTYVIGLGVAVDVVVYSIIIPVIPFQLERLGYSGIASLSGWLLFAYSGGLLIATIPVAMWSEHYNARRYPMLAGMVALMVSQVMFMEAPNYAVMCIARILQGFSSSVIWAVGLALLCDTTPQNIIGRQVGFAMSGLSLGLVLGPPLGGVLYDKFGFRGPFVMALIGASLDFVSRILIIESKETRKWCVDPAIRFQSVAGSASNSSGPVARNGLSGSVSEPQCAVGTEGSVELPVQRRCGVSEERLESGSQVLMDKRLSLLQVIARLSKSPRALAALLISLVYGFVYSSQEPALPLHLQSVWGFTSQRVGVFLLALSVPMLVSSPLTGWLTDILGAEWIVAASMIMAIPWWGLLTLEISLALFGIAFVLESFFTSGAISPLMAELAAVSKSTQGVGYAHIYGAFNVAYGIGTTIGPIVGGQMYDHIQKGWLAVCLLGAALLFMTTVLSVLYTGDKPLLERLKTSICGQLPA